MRCENIFCIYQSEGMCTVEEISVDISGMCSTCVYPDIDNKILESAKSALLEIFDSRDMDE